MPLYTFIMEYAGGTYVSQMEASSPKEACVKWAQKLNPHVISDLDENSKTLLTEQVTQTEPTPIDDTLNTWCVSADISGAFALINLVQTEVAME